MPDHDAAVLTGRRAQLRAHPDLNGFDTGNALVTASGSDQPATLAARFGRVRDISDFAGDGWTEKLNNACAQVSGEGGGVITFYGQETYAFLAEPDDIPAGVYLRGHVNFTRALLPVGNVPCRLFDFRGSIGAAYTLDANIAAGDEAISLASISGLAVGDVLRIQKTPGGLITLGHYTQLVRVEDFRNGDVVLSDPAEFAITYATDTYTISKLNTCRGGGASGFIFDGSLNTSNDCIGVFAYICEGMHFDALGGEYMSGAEPMNGTTVGSVLSMWACFDTRGLNDLWSYKSGSGATNSIQFREMGPTNYGKIYVEEPTGFGVGWYDSTEQNVDAVIENNSWGRTGKMQCVLGFHVGRVRSAKARFTGFAVTEGGRGHIGSLQYHATDLQYFNVVSLVRAGNVATITFDALPSIYNSGHYVVISGATGANDFNGTVQLTRVGTSLSYTYANAGADETAGGTIVCQLNRSPSLWVNDTGCNVVIDHVDIRGAQNPAGDVHTGSNDSVRIGVFRSVSTPKFAGTAGSGATGQGTGRHVFDVNGSHYLPNGLTIAAGGQTMTGQLTVSHSGATPARFQQDNFNYVLSYGSAATSSTVGYHVQSKDSGGVSCSFILSGAAGVARLYQGANYALEIYTNSVLRMQVRADGALRWGSSDVFNVDGNYVPIGYTAAQIADMTHAVNTTNRKNGQVVRDTTNNRLMMSRGTTATSVWGAVDDPSTTVTPA